MSEIELSKDLFSLTMPQLRKLAKDNGVSVFGTRKADIIFALQEAGITSTDGVEPVEEPEPVVETKKEEKNTVEVKPPIEIGKIAVYSKRNLHSPDFGRLNVGYNIVSPAQKDYWINRKPDVVREATPKEVAKYYGVK